MQHLLLRGLRGAVMLSAILALWRPIGLLVAMPELRRRDSNTNVRCVRRPCSPPDEPLTGNKTSTTAFNVCHWASIWSSLFTMSASRNQAVLAAANSGTCICVRTVALPVDTLAIAEHGGNTVALWRLQPSRGCCTSC